MAKRTTAVAKKTAKTKPPAIPMTCFVVIGFGRKTDFATGRVLDLDKTYQQLIKPAFDKVEVNCFRAIDANLTGSIDAIMYQWLFAADFVIADLSTLNANVFYELGVRHALKPNTTIIMAESVLMTKIPFDLSSFVIHQYEHGGDQIAPEERERFVDHLSGILAGIVEAEESRRANLPGSQRLGDSPVFSFMDGMEPHEYTFDQFLPPPTWVPPELREEKPAEAGDSLASVIEAAEEAKKSKRFKEAVRLFNKAVEIGGKDKPDTSLVQRLALVTYKDGEKKDEDGNVDKETAIAALVEAEHLLEQHCAPKISTDPETLGISGAINKRLYDHTGNPEYLERAIVFYERGFYVKQDYYNGINVAFMYTMKANLADSRYAAIVDYGHGNLIREKVAEICQEIIDGEAFGKAPDHERQWVYMTLAEAYQGLGMEKERELLTVKIKSVANEFGMDSYLFQQEKLQQAIDEFHRRVRPETLQSKPPEADAGPQALAPSPAATVTRAAPDPATFGQRPITIDADIVKNKPVKSIEVSCKIEYT